MFRFERWVIKKANTISFSRLSASDEEKVIFRDPIRFGQARQRRGPVAAGQRRGSVAAGQRSGPVFLCEGVEKDSLEGSLNSLPDVCAAELANEE